MTEFQVHTSGQPVTVLVEENVGCWYVAISAHPYQFCVTPGQRLTVTVNKQGLASAIFETVKEEGAPDTPR